FKDKHGLVVGGMSGINYKEYEIDLAPGDKIFLYTDGVPEATNAGKELFGTKRMVDALNKDPDASPKDILRNVRAAVDEFVKDEEQFDDITMLCLKYKGMEETDNSEI
ncbi:MAG: serine/threonine-protein phosphatase, partial [Clostridiales bacterium]|nr:serine/threonine-protein phosphatase [Clostridiales bacterium]